MKTNEVIEGNVLLAEFMGCANQLHLVEHPKTGEYCDPEFHSSWDWLMPVVEKIESLGYDVELGTTYVRIARSDDSGFGLDEWICVSKIDAVFKACVGFAKWYKNQPK